MKIYFHQWIVELIARYWSDLFDRYLGDYSVAAVHLVRRERKESNDETENI